MDYCDSEDMIFSSEQDRYMEILNEVSMTVKMVAAEVHKAQKEMQEGRSRQSRDDQSEGGDSARPLSVAAIEQRLPKGCGQSLMRYGITMDNLIRLARPENGSDELSVGPQNAGSNVVKETQVGFLGPTQPKKDVSNVIKETQVGFFG